LHHYNPHSFLARLRHEGKHSFSIGLSYSALEAMNKILTEIKPINREDTGFMYTCICVDKVTTWVFAYNDVQKKDKAHGTAYDLIAAYARENEVGIDRTPDYFNANKGCVCPCKR
jgi:hypothetical protein